MIIPYSQRYFDRIKRWASSLRRMRVLRARIKSFNPKKVLDVGCGHGFLVKVLNNYGIETIGVDFSEFAGSDMPKDKFVLADATKGLPFSDKEFDVVVSTDFFEHLKDEDIDFTYKEMQRVGKNVVAVISFVKEKVSNSHLSIHPKEWWENKLPGCQIWA